MTLIIWYQGPSCDIVFVIWYQNPIHKFTGDFFAYYIATT
jgi:hypothetical protein